MLLLPAACPFPLPGHFTPSRAAGGAPHAATPQSLSDKVNGLAKTCYLNCLGGYVHEQFH